MRTRISPRQALIWGRPGDRAALASAHAVFRQVTIGAEADSGSYRFFVRDTEPGIQAEHIEKVFDRFWQAGTRDRLCAGLGLATSSGIIRAHGGEIWVESEHGDGAAFYFKLPGGSQAG